MFLNIYSIEIIVHKKNVIEEIKKSMFCKFQNTSRFFKLRDRISIVK